MLKSFVERNESLLFSSHAENQPVAAKTVIVVSVQVAKMASRTDTLVTCYQFRSLVMNGNPLADVMTSAHAARPPLVMAVVTIMAVLAGVARGGTNAGCPQG